MVTVSLDGTKIKADASLSANRTLKYLEQEIDKMLSALTGLCDVELRLAAASGR